MDQKQNYIIGYLQGRLSLNPGDIRRLLSDRTSNDNKTLPKRYITVLINKYIQDFIRKPGNDRWLIVPGLRGVGKTTLVRQVCLDLLGDPHLDINLLSISLDELTDNLQASLYETLIAYRQILGVSLAQVEKPTFIFIDEAQADPNWARTLKSVYDNCPLVFLFCTGSSATYLQIDADIAGRRAQIHRLYPLSFTEFHVLKNGKYPTKGLKQSIVRALYYSDSAKKAFIDLDKMKASVHQQWIEYPQPSLNTYLETGNMTFTLGKQNPIEINQSIGAMLSKVVETDLQRYKGLDFGSIAVIKNLLFVLAGVAEGIAAQKLSDSLGVGRSQIFGFLDILVKAELLVKVPVHGNNLKTVRKPAQYKFMSPSIRHFFCQLTNNTDRSFLYGMFLEDIAALYYYRIFLANGKGNLSYSYGKNQSDFILKIARGNKLAIEFGLGQQRHPAAQIYHEAGRRLPIRLSFLQGSTRIGRR